MLNSKQLDLQPNFDLNLPRFDSKSEIDLKVILDERNAKNTKRATKNNMKIFYDYLEGKNYKPLLDLADEELPDILFKFYGDLRRMNGEVYKLQSLKCIRAGINRYTKAERNLDIISDVRFSRANELFKGKSKVVCKEGKGSTKLYPVIADEDLERIATYFLHDVCNKPDPRKLQKCVLFYIIYFFCRRGRENLYQMSLNTFDIGTDPDGTQYIYQAVDEMDKNHEIDQKDPANQGRMYEKPGNKITH